MNEMYEALMAFSDIPIAVFALIFGFLAVKKIKDKRAFLLFFLISASAFLGTAVHIFKTSLLLYNILWTVLYPLMYESVRLFSHIFSDILSGQKSKEKPFFFIAEAVLCLVSLSLHYFAKYGMLSLVIFSAISFIRIIFAVIKKKKAPFKVIILFFSLLVVVLLQGFCYYIPYSIVFEHIIILLSMIDFFIIAKKQNYESDFTAPAINGEKILCVLLSLIILCSCGIKKEGDKMTEKENKDPLSSLDFSIGNYVAACNQRENNIILYDLDKSENLDDCAIWTLQINEKNKENISAVKFRQNTVYKDVVAVCSSWGLGGLYSFPEGNCIWSNENVGNNPHSVEILPNGAMAFVSSTGKELRIYNTISSDFVSYPCNDGHGVLWDDEYSTLWVLGLNTLYAYDFSPEGRGGTLTLKDEYIIPSLGGHDLSADMTDKTRLFITSSGAYSFNKETKEFEKTENSRDGLKGYGNNKLGNFICCFPNGGKGTDWENESFASWCTSDIYLQKQGAEPIKFTSNTSAFYKTFAFYGGYQ